MKRFFCGKMPNMYCFSAFDSIIEEFYALVAAFYTKLRSVSIWASTKDKQPRRRWVCDGIGKNEDGTF